MKCKLMTLWLTAVMAVACAEGDTKDVDGEAGSTSEGGGGEDVQGGGGEGGEPETGGTGGEGGSEAEGGAGGSVGEGGEGGQGGSPDPICSAGETRCTGLDVEVCNAAGSAWELSETCPFVCNDGACEGECVPGDNQCNGDAIETCDATGTWATTSTCPFVCDAGACTGVCEPGEEQCTAGNAILACDSTGQWTFVEQCPILCSAGACTGSCLPGTKQCAGDAAQTCNAQGQWTTTSTCDFVCSAGTCIGVCEPGATDCQGDVPRTCNAQGQWVNGSACPFVCSVGMCVGVCEPGEVQCSGNGTQTCQNNGQWGNTMSCPDLPNSSPTCGGQGVCGFTCDSQFANCNGGSGCETQLGTVQNCMGCGDSCGPAPANAVSVCTAQGCDFECLAGWDDCDGNASNGCELNTTDDDWNCGGCGVGCFGGTCESSACELAPNSVAGIEQVSLASDVTSMTAKGATALFWTTSTNKVEKAAKAGGIKATLVSNEHMPKGVTVAGSNVIWSNTESGFLSIRSMPIGGGGSTTLVSGHGPVELATDGTSLFWSDQVSYSPCNCATVGSTTIFKAPVGGGSPTVVNPNSQAWQSWPGLAVTNSNIYRLQWWSTSASTLPFRQSKTDTSDYGALTGGVSGLNETSHGGRFLMTTASSTLVYHATLNVSGPALIKIPLNSTSELISLTPALTVKDVVADDTYAYVIASQTGESWDRVIRYSMTNPNAPPTYLANYQYQAANLEIDGSHLYWTINGVKKGAAAQVEGTPTIVKLAK